MHPVDKCKQASAIEMPSVDSWSVMNTALASSRRPHCHVGYQGWVGMLTHLKLKDEGYRSIRRVVHQPKAPTASMQTCYHAYANGVDDADAHEHPHAHVS